MEITTKIVKQTHTNGTIKKLYEKMKKDELLVHIDTLENKILLFEQKEQEREEKKRDCVNKLTNLLNGQVSNNGGK